MATSLLDGSASSCRPRGNLTPSREGPREEVPVELPRATDVVSSSTLTAFLAGKYVVNPKNSVFLPYWDLMMSILIVIISFTTPYEIGFCMQSTSADTWLRTRRARVLLLGINGMFAIDMVLQLFVSFPHPVNHRWVRMPLSIVKNYLAGWFAIDAISVFPWGEMVGYLKDTGGDGFDILGTLQMFSLFKLLRVPRLATRYEARIDVPYTWMKLTHLLGLLALSFHWMACYWGFLLTWQRFHGLHEGYTWGDNLRQSKPGWFADEHKDSPFELFTAALYWSAVTIISIGYGDITANSTFEAKGALVAMATSGLIWAHIIGSICAIASTFDSETIAQENTLDSLNYMMRTLDLPQETRMRLRELFMCRKVLFHREKQVELLRNMSPEQQGIVARWVQSSMMNKVWFLDENTSDAFVVGIFERLQYTVYPPREIVALPRTLVNLLSGVAMSAANIKPAGSLWGVEDLILTDPSLMDDERPLALSYLEIQYLSQCNFTELCASHPAERQRIRKLKMLLTFKRAVVRGHVTIVTEKELREMERRKKSEDEYATQNLHQLEREREEEIRNLAEFHMKHQKTVSEQLESVIFLLDKHIVNTAPDYKAITNSAGSGAHVVKATQRSSRTLTSR